MFAVFGAGISRGRGYFIGRQMVWTAAAIALVAAAGCGQADSRRTPVFPATGKISFKGQAPAGASVVLFPKSGAAKAPDVDFVCPRGRVQSDGTFALTSYRTDDGAPVGEYAVTIEWHKLTKAPDGQPDLGPNLLPPQFSRPDKSPLLVTIVPGKNNLAPIILK